MRGLIGGVCAGTYTRFVCQLCLHELHDGRCGNPMRQSIVERSTGIVTRRGVRKLRNPPDLPQLTVFGDVEMNSNVGMRWERRAPRELNCHACTR